MDVTIDLINKLHSDTGKYMSKCKKALLHSDTYEDAVKYCNKLSRPY